MISPLQIHADYYQALPRPQCLETISRKMFSIIFTEMEMRLTNVQFSTTSLFPFMKVGVTLAFSANQHKLSKTIKNDLTTTSVSSPILRRCISSSLTDLYMSSLFKYSLMWSFSTKGKSCLQTFAQISGTSLFCGLTYKDPNWRRYWVLGLLHVLCQFSTPTPPTIPWFP